MRHTSRHAACPFIVVLADSSHYTSLFRSHTHILVYTPHSLALLPFTFHREGHSFRTQPSYSKALRRLDSILDSPARSQSLYRLSYSDRQGSGNSIIRDTCFASSEIESRGTHSEHVLFNILLHKKNYSNAPQCYIKIYLLSFGIESFCWY